MMPVVRSPAPDRSASWECRSAIARNACSDDEPCCRFASSSAICARARHPMAQSLISASVGSTVGMAKMMACHRQRVHPAVRRQRRDGIIPTPVQFPVAALTGTRAGTSAHLQRPDEIRENRRVQALKLTGTACETQWHRCHTRKFRRRFHPRDPVRSGPARYRGSNCCCLHR